MKFLLCAALVCPAAAFAVDIEFANLATGTVVSNQYSGLTFSANAFTGGNWATNTDMRVATEGSDLAPIANPNTLDKVLHTYTGWLAENGDPSFRVTFDSAVRNVSVTFAGAFPEFSSSTALYAYNGSTLLGSVNVGSDLSTTPTLFWNAGDVTPITSIIITPGSRYDYVAVDLIQYGLVPEPATYALMGAGLLLLVVRKRG